MLESAFGSSHDARRHSNLSNLEKNCNQIFFKAPALTREFFEKINNDVVPQKTAFFGYQMNTRRFIVLTGLILLFTISTMGTVTMWFTDAFRKRIESMFVIGEDSPGYQMWRIPPVKPQVKIHIFNYTNVEKFELGEAEKLHVQETGPYVYHEELERVNMRFNKVDGTVSYQEKRNYRFSPQLSKGSPEDSVIIPNVPLLAGAAVVKKFNFLVRVGYQGLLNALSERAFTTQKALNFVTGYDDHLYDLSKTYLKYEDKPVFDNFGLLVWKQGTQPDIYTANTGVHDITKLGQIEKFNGESHYDMWGSDSCNSIQSSDGVLYPFDKVKAKKEVSFFIPQLCRKVPAHFVGEERMLDKVPVYRYKVPTDVFDSTDNEDNKCYCDKSTKACPPRGLFNATSCSFGTPLFYSLPHFYGADRAVFEGVTGLNGRPTDHDTFMDLHPKFGFILRGKLNLQLNIRVEKSYGLMELTKFPDGLVLPLAWVEFSVEDRDLPEELVQLIYQTSFTVWNLELGLKYGCLLATMVTLTGILLVLKKHRRERCRGDC
ncbi:scavenger receptor class B member 1-like [Euwallacea similis]|uniref:scavenger receptor class B member 1-like n=1 Tax=Euwallacea similis TaxID=1736056 RepID=UPI00344ED3A0